MRRFVLILFFLLQAVFVLGQSSSSPCVDGMTACQSSNFVICDKGVWQLQAHCSATCDSRSGCGGKDGLTQPLVQPTLSNTSSKVCNDGQARCDGQNFQTCSSDSWHVQQTCSGLQDCTNQGCVSKQVTPSELHGLVQAACLSCPNLLLNNFTAPAAPYDETIGDCSMLGHETDVAQYVQSLGDLSGRCRSLADSAMQHAFALKFQIESALESIPVGTEPVPDYSCYSAGITPGEHSCSGHVIRSPSASSNSHGDGWKYSDWLERLTERTLDFCRTVDGLAQPIADECQNVAHDSQICKGTRPSTIVEYKNRIDTAAAEAKDRYDHVDEVYQAGKKERADFMTAFSDALANCRPTKAEPLSNASTSEPLQKKSLLDYLFDFFRLLFGHSS